MYFYYCVAISFIGIGTFRRPDYVDTDDCVCSTFRIAMNKCTWLYWITHISNVFTPVLIKYVSKVHEIHK